MKIAYYMPFKPMGHKNPSGDLIIGSELYTFLDRSGAELQVMSTFRCRWIYLKPHLWPLFLLELLRVIAHCKKNRPDIWLTYHSYYKAPDILGALCCRLLGIPYVIFQGIYSTKRRRSMKTVVGFFLNRMALKQAVCVFTNKRPDEKNLIRLLAKDHVAYVAPGLTPEEFKFKLHYRNKYRQKWLSEEKVVIMATAMFRPGVKTDGIVKVIEACQKIKEQGGIFLLVIAGDGVNYELIEKKAQKSLAKDFVMLGKVARHEMQNYYSAADVFAFPGIKESLGMVFLEAQSCGLPVVAYGDWGASEAVAHNKTGLLSSAADNYGFTKDLKKLIDDVSTRTKMGKCAVNHILDKHDLEKNYAEVWRRLARISNQ